MLDYDLRTHLYGTPMDMLIINKVRYCLYKIQLSAGPVVIRNGKHLKKVNRNCAFPVFCRTVLKDKPQGAKDI